MANVILALVVSWMVDVKASRESLCSCDLPFSPRTRSSLSLSSTASSGSCLCDITWASALDEEWNYQFLQLFQAVKADSSLPLRFSIIRIILCLSHSHLLPHTTGDHFHTLICWLWSNSYFLSPQKSRSKFSGHGRVALAIGSHDKLQWGV